MYRLNKEGLGIKVVEKLTWVWETDKVTHLGTSCKWHKSCIRLTSVPNDV